MAHCASIQYAVETAQALAEPLPEPPQHLDEHARKFWPAVIESKRRTAWSPSDLLVACQLARDYAAVEALSADLDEHGAVLTDPKGKKYTHPAARLLDAATRRIHAGVKTLQIHAIATSGRTDYQAQKNEAARDLARTLGEDDDDDLFASPPRH